MSKNTYIKVKKIILPFFLTTFLTACSNSTKILTKVNIEKVKIPEELLQLQPLSKPKVENELDIINAYSALFYHYKKCEIQISKIKDLNNGSE